MRASNSSLVTETSELSTHISSFGRSIELTKTKEMHSVIKHNACSKNKTWEWITGYGIWQLAGSLETMLKREGRRQ
jgi:hypothetical protein